MHQSAKWFDLPETLTGRHVPDCTGIERDYKGTVPNSALHSVMDGSAYGLTSDFSRGAIVPENYHDDTRAVGCKRWLAGG
jgi:hypothetical protein